MAYATQTTDDRQHPIRFVVEIAGIEQVFVSKAVSPTSLVSNRTQVKTLLQDSLSFGAEVLDVNKRAVTGGGVTIQLHDDADGTLLSLFGFRAATPRTALVTTPYSRSGAETTITVESTSGFDSSGTIHINAEAISYSGTTATTFTGASRAAYGTEKGDHRQGESGLYNGAIVTQVPQAWRGRRVTLKAGYEDADGTMADLATIGTYRILEPPRAVSDGDTYELVCGPLSDVFREARCYLGVRDVTVTSAVATDTPWLGSQDLNVSQFGDSLQFVVGSPTIKNQFILVKSDADTYRLSLVDHVIGNTVYSWATDYLSPNGAALARAINPDSNPIATSLKHVALLRGEPVDMLLVMMTSLEGDTTNGARDLLPGKTSSSFGVHQWRMGAGIDVADINVTDPDSGGSVGSIEHLRGSGHNWTVLLDDVLEVGDLLQEFCMSTGSYWYVDSSGVLNFERLRDLAPPTLTSQTLTIDDSVVLTPAPLLRYSEDNVAHTVRLRANWEPIAGRHMVSVSVIDWELRERYPESAQEIAAESKFMRVSTAGFSVGPTAQKIGGSSAVTVEDVASQLRRAQNLNAFGEAFVELECAWSASSLLPGQFVDLDLPRTPDTKGGRLTNGRGVITSRRLNPGKATVSLTIRVMEAARVIAPVGVIASVSTTTNPNDTWVLNTTDDTIDPDLTSPVDAFAATWQIYCYDINALAGSELKGPFTISSVDQGTDKIIITADPGFVPAAGDYFWPVVNAATPAAVSTLDEDDFLWMTDRDGNNEGSVFS